MKISIIKKMFYQKKSRFLNMQSSRKMRGNYATNNAIMLSYLCFASFDKHFISKWCFFRKQKLSVTINISLTMLFLYTFASFLSKITGTHKLRILFKVFQFIHTKWSYFFENRKKKVIKSEGFPHPYSDCFNASFDKQRYKIISF